MEQHTQRASPSRKGKEPVTFASKVASSASGLAKSAIGCSNANDLSTTLSSGIATNTKVVPGFSSGASSHWLHDLPLRSGKSSVHGRAGSPSGSFRSSPVEEVHNHEFDEFLSCTRTPLSPSPEPLCSAQDAWTHGFPVASPTREGHWHDGGEVQTLLSNTNSMDYEMVDRVDESTHDALGKEFSAEEQRIADRITAALPPAPEHHAVSPHHTLHLRADWPTETRYQDSSSWDDILNGYIEDARGFESLTSAQLNNLKQEDLQTFLSTSNSLDGQALTRLKLILGHVSESAQSTSLQQQSQSFSQISLDAMRQDSIATSRAMLENQAQRSFEQTMNGHASDAAIQHTFNQDHATIHGESTLHRTHHQPVKRDSRMADQDMPEEQTTPTFHCPWIRCHQRFNNVAELQIHANAHTQYACPHEGCIAQFRRHEDWAQHIVEPHHDLLEESFRTLISSEN